MFCHGKDAYSKYDNLDSVERVTDDLQNRNFVKQEATKLGNNCSTEAIIEGNQAVCKDIGCGSRMLHDACQLLPRENRSSAYVHHKHDIVSPKVSSSRGFQFSDAGSTSGNVGMLINAPQKGKPIPTLPHINPPIATAPRSNHGSRSEDDHMPTLLSGLSLSSIYGNAEVPDLVNADLSNPLNMLSLYAGITACTPDVNGGLFSNISNEDNTTVHVSNIAGNMDNASSSQNVDFVWDGMKGYCTVCPAVSFTSIQNLKEHIKGKKHVSKKVKAQLVGKLSNTASVQTLSNPQADDVHLELPDLPKEFEWDGLNGKCLICPEDIVFTSSAHMRQHTNGQKHNKHKNKQLAALKVTASKDASSSSHCSQSGSILGHDWNGIHGKCLVCPENINFTSKEHFQLHVNGKKHAKSILKYNSPLAPNMSHNVSTVTDISGKKLVEIDLETGTGHCFLCSVAFTSMQHYDLHISGKKHMKMEERNRETCCAEYCPLCKVAFSSTSNFLSHIEGAKHRRELELQQEDKSQSSCSSRRFDPAPGGAVR